MEFKQWLIENEGDIRFTAFAKDGTVVVYINGKRYVYITDAMYHDKWKRMIPYSPWKVLNIIKTQVAKGQANMVEPIISQNSAL
jgi:hypothetical protein